MNKKDTITSMTKSLMLKIKQTESKEQIESDINVFADTIMKMFTVPYSTIKTCLCDGKPEPRPDNVGRLRCKNCGICIY